MDAAVGGMDVLVIAPTGMGKVTELCYSKTRRVANQQM